MSSLLTLILLGQAYFLGTSPNISSIGSLSSSSIQPKIEQTTIQLTLDTPIRRADYTYTPGVGAHKIHSTAKKWNEARLICEEEGAHLAIINSPAESKAIARLFPKSWPHYGSDHQHAAMVGFHDLYQEGQYVTIHGDSLRKAGFDEWNSGEPNNAGGVENCGSVWSTGGLNDVSCVTHTLAFVCELPIMFNQGTPVTPTRSALDLTSTEEVSREHETNGLHVLTTSASTNFVTTTEPPSTTSNRFAESDRDKGNKVDATSSYETEEYDDMW